MLRIPQYRCAQRSSSSLRGLFGWLLLTTFVTTGCGGSSNAGSTQAIAGLWDATTTTFGADGDPAGQDIDYIEVLPNGRLNYYDYDQDSVGLGRNCYDFDSDQIESIGNNRYRFGDGQTFSAAIVNGRLVGEAVDGEAFSWPPLTGLSTVDFLQC